MQKKHVPQVTQKPTRKERSLNYKKKFQNGRCTQPDSFFNLFLRFKFKTALGHFITHKNPIKFKK